jgi:branched-subunit amino acid ABC-type transport system permease component
VQGLDAGFLFFQTVTGIAMGANLFLLAAGLSLIFGVVNVVNFAHASFYMLASYICYSLTLYFGRNEGYWLSLLIAPIAVGVLGGIVEKFLFRRVYGRGHYPQIVVAWGLILILNDAFKLIWGTEPKMISSPNLFSGGVTLPGGTLSMAQIFSITVAAIVGFGLYFFLYTTRAGKVVRAAAVDPEITDAIGVDVDRLYRIVFAFACWLGGLGGVVAALQKPASIGGDLDIMLTAFIIVIVGGMGSILGSLVGSLIVGVITALGILVLPRFALVFLYILMVLILILRPYGILGKPELR